MVGREALQRADARVASKSITRDRRGEEIAILLSDQVSLECERSRNDVRESGG